MRPSLFILVALLCVTSIVSRAQQGGAASAFSRSAPTFTVDPARCGLP